MLHLKDSKGKILYEGLKIFLMVVKQVLRVGEKQGKGPPGQVPGS